MRTRLGPTALIALVALAACHRRAADWTPDADAAAQATTAAKTLADIDAAQAIAARPRPIVRPAPAAPRIAPVAAAVPTAPAEAEAAPEIDDGAPANSATPD